MDFIGNWAFTHGKCFPMILSAAKVKLYFGDMLVSIFAIVMDWCSCLYCVAKPISRTLPYLDLWGWLSYSVVQNKKTPRTPPPFFAGADFFLSLSYVECQGIWISMSPLAKTGVILPLGPFPIMVRNLSEVFSVVVFDGIGKKGPMGSRLEGIKNLTNFF